MIANETQYRVTRSAVEELRRALETRGQSEVEGVHPLLVEAHWAGVADELASLERELSEYEKLKLGQLDLSPTSLDDLPDVLIRARIAKGLTQRGLAELLELKTQQVQRYEAERYRSASFARILTIARVLGIDIAQDTEEFEPLEELPSDIFPVSEMARRGWFEDFPGTPLQAKKQGDQLLPIFFKNAGMYGNQLAYHRKSLRKGEGVNDAALLAWEGRVRSVALRREIKTVFSEAYLTDAWVKELVQLSVLPEGPLQAVAELHSIGIIVVYEPPLQGTRLDGAALQLYTGTPVIGLTIRFDRIDNFWFTLLHEIGHVKLHLKQVSQGAILDDLEAAPENPVESQADQFSQEALISEADWRRCISRFSRTEKAVLRDAMALGLHPAIIAGRVRREAGDYTILNGLVGAHQVRHLFHERFEFHETD